MLAVKKGGGEKKKFLLRLRKKKEKEKGAIRTQHPFPAREGKGGFTY